MKKLDPNKAYNLLPDNKVVEVFPKTGYKFKISISQSVSSGFYGISCDTYFDSAEDFLHSNNGAKEIRDLIQSVETVFNLDGYKLAKNIEEKKKQ